MATHNFTSIFASDQPQPTSQQSYKHPHTYFSSRNQFLNTLSQKYGSSCRLATFELKRNAKIDYYMQQYQQKLKQVEQQKLIKNSYLDSNQFQTVFGECQQELRDRRRQQLQQQRLRQSLRNLQQVQKQTHQSPTNDQNLQQEQHLQKLSNQTVLVDYRSDPTKKKEMYLLDLQIGKLTLESRLQKQIKQQKNICRNQKILQKLSNSIIASYLTNFDQIFAALMDDLLEQEVYYLNYIEANYHIQKQQKGHLKQKQTDIQKRQKNQIQSNMQVIKIMDLVKRLQQLCDD